MLKRMKGKKKKSKSELILIDFIILFLSGKQTILQKLHDYTVGTL